MATDSVHCRPKPSSRDGSDCGNADAAKFFARRYASLGRDPAEGDENLYRYCENNPVNMTDPSGLSGGSGGGRVWDPGLLSDCSCVEAVMPVIENNYHFCAQSGGWRLDVSGHGAPHIQLGNMRWDAVTLRPVPHMGVTPPPLTKSQLTQLAKSGVLKEVAEKFPNSIANAAAKEALGDAIRQGAKKGISKAAAKQWAKEALRRLPVVVLIFAGEDYAQGGWEKAAKNVVVPGDLIESTAGAIGDMYDDWYSKKNNSLLKKRFGSLADDDPELKKLQR